MHHCTPVTSFGLLIMVFLYLSFTVWKPIFPSFFFSIGFCLIFHTVSLCYVALTTLKSALIEDWRFSNLVWLIITDWSPAQLWMIVMGSYGNLLATGLSFIISFCHLLILKETIELLVHLLSAGGRCSHSVGKWLIYNVCRILQIMNPQSSRISGQLFYSPRKKKIEKQMFTSWNVRLTVEVNGFDSACYALL